MAMSGTEMPSKRHGPPTTPCVVELDSRDLREQIDAERLPTDHDDRIAFDEPQRFEIRKWRSKIAECQEDTSTVLHRGPDPEVHVFGEARVAVRDDRLAADQEEVNGAGGERPEQFDPVG